MSETIQYIIVFVILGAIIARLIYKLVFKKDSDRRGSCCGCSLSDHCAPEKKKEHDRLRKSKTQTGGNHECCDKKES